MTRRQKQTAVKTFLFGASVNGATARMPWRSAGWYCNDIEDAIRWALNTPDWREPEKKARAK